MDSVSIDNLITQCASGVAPSTMAAIIKVESAGNPWAIGDNTTKRRVYPNPKSAEEAAKIANMLISKGHSLDLGISQINSANLKPYKISIREIFDPCINVAVGSSILSNFYAKSVKEYGTGLTSLYHALSAYNTGSFYRGSGYVNKILKAAGSNATTTNVAWKKPNNSSSNKSTKHKPKEIYNAPILVLYDENSFDESINTANEIMPISY